MNRFLEFFQDDTGQLSSMRLAFLLFSFAVTGAFIFNTVKLVHPAVDFSAISVLAALAGCKVLQGISENGPSPPKPQ